MSPSLRFPKNAFGHNRVQNTDEHRDVNNQHGHSCRAGDIALLIQVNSRYRGKGCIIGIEKNNTRYGRHSVDKQIDRDVENGW